MKSTPITGIAGATIETTLGGHIELRQSKVRFYDLSLASANSLAFLLLQAIAELEAQAAKPAPAAPAAAPITSEPPVYGWQTYWKGNRVSFQGKVYELVVTSCIGSPISHADHWRRVDGDAAPSGPSQWKPGQQYVSGEQVTHLGKTYKMDQNVAAFGVAHTCGEPGSQGSCWKVVEPETPAPVVWVAERGKRYPVGALVSFEGKTYKAKSECAPWTGDKFDSHRQCFDEVKSATTTPAATVASPTKYPGYSVYRTYQKGDRVQRRGRVWEATRDLGYYGHREPLASNAQWRNVGKVGSV